MPDENEPRDRVMIKGTAPREAPPRPRGQRKPPGPYSPARVPQSDLIVSRRAGPSLPCPASRTHQLWELIEVDSASSCRYDGKLRCVLGQERLAEAACLPPPHGGRAAYSSMERTSGQLPTFGVSRLDCTSDWIVEKATSGGVRVRTYWYVIESVDFYPYRFPDAQSRPDILLRLLSEHPPFRDLLSPLGSNAQSAEMEKIVCELKNHQSQMLNRFNGWRTIQNGIAQRHNAVEFRPGAITYNLFEKQ